MKRNAIPLDGKTITWMASRHLNEDRYGFLAYPMFHFMGRKNGEVDYLLFVPDDGKFESDVGVFDINDPDFKKIAGRKYGMPEPSVEALLDPERNRSFMTALANGMGTVKAVPWNVFQRILPSFLGWTPTLDEPPSGHPAIPLTAMHERWTFFFEGRETTDECSAVPMTNRIRHDGKPVSMALLRRLAEFDTATDGIHSITIAEGMVTVKNPCVILPYEEPSRHDASSTLHLYQGIPYPRGEWKTKLPKTMTHRILSAMFVAAYAQWMGPEADECLKDLLPEYKPDANDLATVFKYRGTKLRSTVARFVAERHGAPMIPITHPVVGTTVTHEGEYTLPPRTTRVGRGPGDFIVNQPTAVLEHTVLGRMADSCPLMTSNIFGTLYPWVYDNTINTTVIYEGEPRTQTILSAPLRESISLGPCITLIQDEGTLHEARFTLSLHGLRVSPLNAEVEILMNWLRPLLFNHWRAPIQVRVLGLAYEKTFSLR